MNKVFFKYKGADYNKDKYHVIIDSTLYSVLWIDSYFDRVVGMSKCSIQLKDEYGNEMELNNITMDDFGNMIEDVEPIANPKNNTVDYDNPESIGRGSGILWYLLAVMIGSIFKDAWLIWIVASAIFFPWITNKIKFKK